MAARNTSWPPFFLGLDGLLLQSSKKHRSYIMGALAPGMQDGTYCGGLAGEQE